MTTNETIPVPAPKEKKKRINSKKKGNHFEGHVAKLLSTHLAPMKFRRSQSSGAILGGENSRFMESYSYDAKALFIGDVVPTNEADVFRDEEWRIKFTLECKFYRDPDNIEHLLKGTRIFDWYDKARTDAAKLNKQPLLIFKFNHTSMMCGIEDKYSLPKDLSYSVTIGSPSIRINIFMFEDAIKDIAWWKQLKGESVEEICARGMAQFNKNGPALIDQLIQP